MKTIFAIVLTVAAVAQTSTVVIVPASLRDAANTLAAAEFDPAGGQATFTIGLITPPATNVTHYWCAVPFSATNRAKLNVLTNTPPFAGNVLVGDYELVTDPAAPERMLQTNGLAPYAPPLN